MSENETISDEQLQAFVDGQLDGRDRARVLLALEQSQALRAQVGELRRLKDLVRLAYDEMPAPRREAVTQRRIGGLALAAAAGALATLAITQLVDWGLRGRLSDAPRTIASSTVAEDPEMVMFHISTSDDEVADQLLDQVELVASQFRHRGRALRIMIVANNEGLRLYQVGHARNARRIEELFARFANITFAACGNTLNRFARSGERLRLVPQALVVDSGVAEIARRQRQGWKYIRI